MVPSKESILAAKLPVAPVDVSEVGADAVLYIRALTGWERADIEKACVVNPPTENPGNFRGEILVRCIADSEGKRLFEDGDVNALMSCPAGMLERLFNKACEINGFTKADVEETEKN